MSLDLTRARMEIDAEAARLREISALTTNEPETASQRSFEPELHFEAELDSIPGTECNVRVILSFDGQEFIRQAYRCILRREADPDGLEYYYDLLVSGTKKFEIIVRMRASREGRLAGTRLTLWFWPALHLVLTRIPGLGYLFDILIELVLLPRSLRKIVLRQELLREKINRILRR
ncbi:MAG: DUF4214 domain-containing protein [Spirochaetia bacterium]|nr:DUF4214 domain-containing protein [Spirochaetia bacterium]